MEIKNLQLISKLDCEKIVQRALNIKEFKIIDYSIKPYSEEFGGFLGEYLKITINVDIENKHEKIELFAKLKPEGNDDVKNQFANEFQAYLKEEFIFNTFILDKNVDFAPKLYLSKPDHLLVMEDMALKGYRTPKLLQDYDLTHCKIALKTIASFHAATIAYEQKCSMERKSEYKIGVEYPEMFEEALYVDEDKPIGNSWLISNKNALEELIDLLPKNDMFVSPEILKEKVNKKLYELIEIVKPSKIYRNIVCHGDLWGNNMMFKYQEDGKPLDCVLIDFQLTRYNPPAHDVLTFMYLNTTPEFRKQYFHDMLDYYYECLNEKLKNKGLLLKNIIPKIEFLSSLRYILALAKIQCAIYKITHMLPAEYVLNLLSDPEVYRKFMFIDKAEHIKLFYATDKNYKRKAIEIMREVQDEVLEEHVSIEDCYKLMKVKLNSTNFDILGFNTSQISAEKSGYLGEHRMLNVEVQTKGKNKRFSFFVKIMPENDFSLEMLKETNAFYKEVFIYDLFQTMLSNGIYQINDFAPQCYIARLNQCIILENLAEIGYQTPNKYKYLNFDEVISVITALAKLHVSSLIYEEKMSKKYQRRYRIGEEYCDNFSEQIYTTEEKGWLGVSIEAMTKVIDLFFPNQTDGISDEEFKLKIKKLAYKFASYVKPSTKYRNVITHADVWANNFMIKYGLSMNPTSTCIIDFQFARYTIPANDVMYFIYFTTSREFQEKNMSVILKTYHHVVSTELRNCGIEVEEVFLFEDFIASCEYIKPYALLNVSFVSQFVLSDNEYFNEIFNNPYLTEMMYKKDRFIIIEENCKRQPCYKNRLEELTYSLRKHCETLLL